MIAAFEVGDDCVCGRFNNLEEGLEVVVDELGRFVVDGFKEVVIAVVDGTGNVGRADHVDLGLDGHLFS